MRDIMGHTGEGMGMEHRTTSKEQVLALMRRLGLYDKLAAAERELPDVIDITADQEQLAELGLGVDEATNMMGGSP
jgi:hypothetical protein